jgi:hypothetical protein
MRVLLIAIVAVALSGCTCPEPYAVFAGDFEYCEGTCEWWATGEGSVEQVTTVHPGEHAMRMDGPIRITGSSAVGAGQYYSTDLWFEMVTTCEGAVTAQLSAVGFDQYELQIRLPPGPAVEPSERSYFPVFTNMPLRPASRYDPNCNPNVTECCDPTVDWDCYNDAYDGSSAYSITNVSVINTSGVCTVDQIRVMSHPECY